MNNQGSTSSYSSQGANEKTLSRQQRPSSESFETKFLVRMRSPRKVRTSGQLLDVYILSDSRSKRPTWKPSSNFGADIHVPKQSFRRSREICQQRKSSSPLNFNAGEKSKQRKISERGKEKKGLKLRIWWHQNSGFWLAFEKCLARYTCIWYPERLLKQLCSCYPY